MLTNQEPISLYIHIPFCRSKCIYCDFCSHTPAEGEIDRYISALKEEIRLRACARPAATIYFGGGTPSFIGADRLADILQSLRGSFAPGPDCEITVEANPCDVSDAWLNTLRTAGVNRLSIGLQGMRDVDLRFLGRAHTVADGLAAVSRARAAGFKNIGVDLIVGLPGHTSDLTGEILARAVRDCAPEHISCYQLTVAEGTPLDKAVKRVEVRLPDAGTEAAIFMTTHETLDSLGYEGYEVSNFAKAPEYRSRHNSAYWAHRDYLGFGPAAHSFIHPVRSWNTKSTEKYCESLERGELPIEGSEELTPDQLASEIIMLGLRTRDGFSLESLRDYGFCLQEEKSSNLQQAQQKGFLKIEDGWVRPMLAGMAVADSLAVKLAP